MLQDDVNARLEASESKESAKVPESSNGTNPVTTLGEKSDSGLAKLDAGEQTDETPVEDKVEAVAGALGKEEEAESTVVNSCFLSSPPGAAPVLRAPLPPPLRHCEKHMQYCFLQTSVSSSW